MKIGGGFLLRSGLQIKGSKCQIMFYCICPTPSIIKQVTSYNTDNNFLWEGNIEVILNSETRWRNCARWEDFVKTLVISSSDLIIRCWVPFQIWLKIEYYHHVKLLSISSNYQSHMSLKVVSARAMYSDPEFEHETICCFLLLQKINESLGKIQ